MIKVTITYFTFRSRISQCRELFFQNRSRKLFSPSFISIVILGVSLFPEVYFLPLRGHASCLMRGRSVILKANAKARFLS